jgi:hypothetical protein
VKAASLRQLRTVERLLIPPLAILVDVLFSLVFRTVELK